MMKQFCLIALLAALVGCANVNPTSEGKAVKILENKPSNCEELGSIDTTPYYIDDEEEAVNCNLLDDYVCMEEKLVYDVRLDIIMKELEAKYGNKITQERKNNT